MLVIVVVAVRYHMHYTNISDYLQPQVPQAE
jgi:hypothetical protein